MDFFFKKKQIPLIEYKKKINERKLIIKYFNHLMN